MLTVSACVCVLYSSDNRCVIGARVVWGIDGIDRDGTDETDSDDVGLVEYHSAFDLTRPEAQQVCSATYSMLHSTHSQHCTHTPVCVRHVCGTATKGVVTAPKARRDGLLHDGSECLHPHRITTP